MPRLGPAALAVLATASRLSCAAEPRALALAVYGRAGHSSSPTCAPRSCACSRMASRASSPASSATSGRSPSSWCSTPAWARAASFARRHSTLCGASSRSLPEGSKCTLWSTGDRPRKLGALDGDRKAVDKKVGQGFAIEGANTLMDTLAEAEIALANESGKRRAIVVLSGSGAGHTSRSPADVSKEARRASAPVFALMYGEGEGASAGSLRLGDTPRDAANLTIVGSADHERILSGLAQGTGGRFERLPSVLGVGAALVRWPPSSAASTGSATCPARARGRGGSRCGWRARACTGASRSTAHEGERMKKVLLAGGALILLAGIAPSGWARTWPPGSRRPSSRKRSWPRRRPRSARRSRCRTWRCRSSPGSRSRGSASRTRRRSRRLGDGRRVRVALRLLPLLGGRVEVDRLALEKPVLALAMDAKGGLDYERLGGPRRRALAAKPGQAAPMAAAPLRIVDDGARRGERLDRDERPGEGAALAVEDIDFRSAFEVASGMARRGREKSASGKANVGGRAFRARGQGTARDVEGEGDAGRRSGASLAGGGGGRAT